jgi:hypothetical protein
MPGSAQTALPSDIARMMSEGMHSEVAMAHGFIRRKYITLPLHVKCPKFGSAGNIMAM